MHAPEPVVTTLVVTYNSIADIGACLDALAPLGLGPVVVYDNASTDGTAELVASRYPWVELIRSKQNLGYAKAVNQGMRSHPDADYFLVLNPDVVADGPTIDALLSCSRSAEGCGISAPQLVYPDLSLQASYRSAQTPFWILLRRTFLGSTAWGQAMLSRHLLKGTARGCSEVEADWVVGACMLVNRRAVEAIGGMDERFFLYFEDVDWCLRMWRHGFRVVCFPALRLVHAHKRESARSPWRLGVATRLHLRSALKFYLKYPLLGLSIAPSWLPSARPAPLSLTPPRSAEPGHSPAVRQPEQVTL